MTWYGLNVSPRGKIYGTWFSILHVEKRWNLEELGLGGGYKLAASSVLASNVVK
jgi:hypothetical protein